MKCLKKSTVSQRATMDIKQNILDHFRNTAKSTNMKNADLNQQAKGKYISEELPGLMKQSSHGKNKLYFHSPETRN